MIVLASTLTWKLTSVGNAQTRPAAPRAVNTATAKPVPPPLPANPISLEGAVLMGSTNAKLVVIEYSDVQCPYCGAFVRETLPAFDREFVKTGKVLLAFRNFPLEQLHPFAKSAALAIECAGQQNKAWLMHDKLFANPKALNNDTIAAGALAVGIAGKPFSSCMGSAQASARVSEDVASGRELGVTGTPTFFVGSKLPDGSVKLLERFVGAVPISQWQASLTKWSAEAGTK
jgi:protein-disulfide isomerase